MKKNNIKLLGLLLLGCILTNVSCSLAEATSNPITEIENTIPKVTSKPITEINETTPKVSNENSANSDIKNETSYLQTALKAASVTIAVAYSILSILALMEENNFPKITLPILDSFSPRDYINNYPIIEPWLTFSNRERASSLVPQPHFTPYSPGKPVKA